MTKYKLIDPVDIITYRVLNGMDFSPSYYAAKLFIRPNVIAPYWRDEPWRMPDLMRPYCTLLTSQMWYSICKN
jgi:hypothetical protein